MRKLTREALLAVVPELMTPPLATVPLQAALGKDPWRITLASILLCRARRAQAEPAFLELTSRWPTPEAMARADLENVVRPCGFQVMRAKNIRRISELWRTDRWGCLRDLPGVGAYVNDAVGLFCFGYTDLDSNDHVLKEYANAIRATEGVLGGVLDCQH